MLNPVHDFLIQSSAYFIICHGYDPKKFYSTEVHKGIFFLIHNGHKLEKHVSIDLGFEKSNQGELNSFPARSLQIYQKKKQSKKHL